MKHLLQDEGGWASPEWVLVITVLVLGAITGSFLNKQARLAYQEPVTREKGAIHHFSEPASK